MPVCLNHTDRESTTRCVTCFKPLCGDCVIRRGREVFCSAECRENYLRTAGAAGRFAARERAAQHRRLITRLVVVLVSATVIIGACLVLLVRPDLLP